MDMTASIAPKSDQLNADDLIGGPRTFTVANVTPGSSEQPVNVELAELPGRPYKPSKTMRRVLVAGWGVEASEYIGRRLTLYRDPEVKFGGIALGGIKISHMSGLDQQAKLMLTSAKGKKAPHIVQPLIESAPTEHVRVEPTAEQVAACTDIDQLRDMHRSSGPERKAQIEARVAELQANEPAGVQS